MKSIHTLTWFAQRRIYNTKCLQAGALEISHIRDSCRVIFGVIIVCPSIKHQTQGVSLDSKSYLLFNRRFMIWGTQI